MKRKQSFSRGSTSVLALIFMSLFAALSVSFAALSNTNLQMARSHRDLAMARTAAESGLQYAIFLVSNYIPPSEAFTAHNTVNEQEADDTLFYFSQHVEQVLSDSDIIRNVSGNQVVSPGDIVGWHGAESQFTVPAQGNLPVQSNSTALFSLRFKLETNVDDNTPQIVVTSMGTHGTVSRAVQLTFPIEKESQVLSYAVASRSRVIITGDSTIDGDIFSTWDHPEIAPPFTMDAQSTVNGNLDTVLFEDDFADAGYALEDEVHGQYDSINYGEEEGHMTGMDISDYDTSQYNDSTTILPASDTIQNEYFPHVAGDYSRASDGSSRQLQRHVYENQTFTNANLPAGRNALFNNCTFEGILYIGIDSNTNNVRFNNCQFDGAIVTGVASDFLWTKNVLYFTGSANFDNQFMEESTILAPNFNVNLGNTQELQATESVLTGAIIGGIVDIRGNAKIDGTILSMYDPIKHGSSARAYGTNVGFSDENNEAGIPEDIGTITISPDPTRLLPSGIVSPIVITRDGNSYVEF